MEDSATPSEVGDAGLAGVDEVAGSLLRLRAGDVGFDAGTPTCPADGTDTGGAVGSGRGAVPKEGTGVISPADRPDAPDVGRGGASKEGTATEPPVACAPAKSAATVAPRTIATCTQRRRRDWAFPGSRARKIGLGIEGAVMVTSTARHPCLLSSGIYVERPWRGIGESRRGAAGPGAIRSRSRTGPRTR